MIASRAFGSISKRAAARIEKRSPVRHLSSKKGSTPPKSKNEINKPPEINFDPRQGNSILHQKAARAAEIHAELNTLLETQAQRRADEANRHFGAGFLDFVKKSKSEIINIVAAFTCVCLAWQITSIRSGARKLIENAEENNQKMEDQKQVLRILTSNEFLERVSKEHHDELKDMGGNATMNNDVGGWFGRKSTESGNTAVKTQSNKKSQEILVNVLQRELIKVIGDRALTSAEIEEKKLLQLQKEMGIVQQARRENDSAPKQSDNSLGGLEKMFVEVQSDDSGSGRTVVKRSKGFI